MDDLPREERVWTIGVGNLQPNGPVDPFMHEQAAPATVRMRIDDIRQPVGYARPIEDQGVQLGPWAPLADGRDIL